MSERGTKTGRTRIRPKAVSLKRLQARVCLVWENAWLALWPAVCLFAAFAGVALLGGFSWLPAWLHVAALAVFACLLGFTSWWAYRTARWPSGKEVVRRLQTDSGLSHRPLEALDDRLPDGIKDPSSIALWEAHRRRMAESVANLRVAAPAPGLPSRDPWAVRMAALLLLVVGVVVGGGDALNRIGNALMPDLRGAGATQDVALELWIAPPDYTLAPPIFPEHSVGARSDGQAQEPDSRTTMSAVGRPAPSPPEIEVPAGSMLTAIVSGGGGDAVLQWRGERIPFETVDSRNRRLERALSASGRLTVFHDDEVLGSWRIRSRPDQPPSIAFEGEPEPSKRGTLRLAYKATDDYGIAEIEGDMRRTYERGTLIGKEVSVLQLPTVTPGTREIDETSFQEIGPHPWAGLPVAIRLRAKDAAGQVGESEELRIVLPEREFTHPVARRIISERRLLTTHPERRREISGTVWGVSRSTGAYRDDAVVFMGLVMSAMRLVYEREDTAIPPVRDLLWDVALRVEDGLLSHAERELARAHDALMKALAENASDSELERLMRELQAALDDYLREITRKLANTPDSEMLPMDPAAQIMRGTDLQRLLRDIQRMMMSGARENARDMLARLRQTLEALRNARVMRPSPQSRQGMQTLQALQDLIRRQQQLLDRTFRQSQGMGDGERVRQEMRTGAGEQRRLREALEALRGSIRQMMQNGGSAAQPFGRAGEAMDEAARALDRFRPGDAVGPQSRALEALQRAGQRMLQQMIGQGTRGPGMGMQNSFNPLRIMRDPLGRELFNETGTDVRTIDIPDQGTVERTHQIMEELRRRSGQSHRPRLELDYIDRLLQRF